MGEYCTCGATLPPDARFCHKCGKPQYDEPLFNSVTEDPAQEAPVSEATPPPLPQKVGINFHNSVAVRVGFFAAGLMMLLLLFIPIPGLEIVVLKLLMLLAGGFFSVYLYRRRTGESLTVRGGARMGWITGVFCFVIMTVFFTIFIIQISTPDGRAEFSRMLISQGGTPDMINQLNEALITPSGIFGVLIMLFVMLTLLPAVGGALGAKVLAKE